MKFRIVIITVLIIVVSGCGFKVVDQNFLDGYVFTETSITGDNRVTYLLKNQLNRKNDNSSKKLKLEIITTKTKAIKEKNIQNQITKYKIKITATVDFKLIEKNKSGKFTVYKEGDYNVSNRYGDTLNNERKLVKNIVHNIGEQIFTGLEIRLNEF